MVKTMVFDPTSIEILDNIVRKKEEIFLISKLYLEFSLKWKRGYKVYYIG